MKRRKSLNLPVIGGTSLLVIFVVLCMTILALLSLSSVLARQRIADVSVQSVSDYYAADLQAEDIFARLRNNEIPASVQVQQDRYCYVCPISDHQQLEVEVRKTGESWQILRWQAVARPESPDETIPVWDGR